MLLLHGHTQHCLSGDWNYYSLMCVYCSMITFMLWLFVAYFRSSDNSVQCSWVVTDRNVQYVPLATELGISLIILTPLRILQRNLKQTYLIVKEMWQHHNMRWKWSPFDSRQHWTQRAIFWKVFASTSAATAWISSVMFAFKASMVRGLFW
jgi:hypothetical protein